jgi:hypothetical protein
MLKHSRCIIFAAFLSAIFTRTSSIADAPSVFHQPATSTHKLTDLDMRLSPENVEEISIEDIQASSLKSSQTLAMPSFTMQNIDDLAPSTSHCVPTAITRAFNYEYWQGFTRIMSSSLQLFKEVQL